MDRKGWEMSNSDMALFETNHQLDSQQMEHFHENQWASQAQMENRRIFEEFAMKRIFYQESHASKVKNHGECAVKKRKELGN